MSQVNVEGQFIAIQTVGDGQSHAAKAKTFHLPDLPFTLQAAPLETSGNLTSRLSPWEFRATPMRIC